MSNIKIPEDSIEAGLETDPGQSTNQAQQNIANQMAQSTSGQGGSRTTSSVNAVTSLANPDSWIRDLYGLPQKYDEAEKAKEQKNAKSNHTPLDPNKLSQNKSEVSPSQMKFYKKYQHEYDEFLKKKKKSHADEQKREEEEKKRREEERQKQIQKEQTEQAPRGKIRKSVLGQVHRKATTELRPETKAGGTK